MQQVAIVPEKAPCNDDDGEMSTASGASSDPVSLPASPLKAWPNTPADTVSLPSSPLKASPDTPADEIVARATLAGAGPVSLADLPSLGSIGHFVGEKRTKKRKPVPRSVPAHWGQQERQAW